MASIVLGVCYIAHLIYEHYSMKEPEAVTILKDISIIVDESLEKNHVCKDTLNEIKAICDDYLSDK